MEDSPGTALLASAHTIVAEMLMELRTLVPDAQRRTDQLTQELRQTARSLDEVMMQQRLASERQGTNVVQLAERERTIRTTYARLEKEQQAVQHSLKQLDQLIRQIEMSSSTLDGESGTGADDPWALALRSQVILGREEERVRLAREVHDGPAQVLANGLMLAEQSRHLIREQRIEQLLPLLDRLCSATREGLHEVRQFIANLRPGRLAEQGLVAALHDYIQRHHELYGAPVTFEADTLPRLRTEVAIVLYRVTQEALQNAHKHARGATVTVSLLQRNNQLRLTIRDEGKGFDPREVARRAGRESWGLTSMRERAEMIGARLKVSSSPGRGTEVSVALPLKQG